MFQFKADRKRDPLYSFRARTYWESPTRRELSLEECLRGIVNPTLSNPNVNRPLTRMSIGFVQDQKDFVAGDIFPPMPLKDISLVMMTKREPTRRCLKNIIDEQIKALSKLV